MKISSIIATIIISTLSISSTFAAVATPPEPTSGTTVSSDTVKSVMTHTKKKYKKDTTTGSGVTDTMTKKEDKKSKKKHKKDTMTGSGKTITGSGGTDTMTKKEDKKSKKKHKKDTMTGSGVTIPLPKTDATTGRTYITGPDGGCYYMTANNNKEYVDKKLCAK